MKKSPLFIILIVAFVDLVSYGLIIPLQASYAERMGANGLTFGLLVGTYSLMQLIFNPLLGRWSDRVGRRRVLLISVFGSIFSHLLLGVADLASSLPLLFLARTLDGITGANISTAQAYIADVTTKENRAKGMGMFGAAFGLGFVMGPAIGAGLVFLGGIISGPAYGTAWPAFGAAVISATAFFLIWKHLPESNPDATDTASQRRVPHLKTMGSLFHQPRLRELFTLTFSITFSFVLLEITFVFLCTHFLGVREAGAGLIFAYIGILMVIVQGGLVGRLAKRYGEASLIAFAPFITAIGFVIISFVAEVDTTTWAWAALLIGCIPVAFGNGLTTPSVNALVSKESPKDQQGIVLGTNQALGSLARALGPLAGGAMYDVRAALPYWVGAGLFVAIGVYAVKIRPRHILNAQS